MSGLVTRDVEALARALGEHRLHPSMNICTGCNWRAVAGGGSLFGQHEAHRAQALIDSGAVALLADAVGALAEDEALVRRVSETARTLPDPPVRSECPNTHLAIRALAAALRGDDQ